VGRKWAESKNGKQELAAMADTLRGIAEVAKLFGVSHFTIRRLIDGGHLRAVNIGSRWLIPNAEIERVVTQGAGVPRRRKRHAASASAGLPVGAGNQAK
jgi:excisionase family DNA binding protein